MFKYQSANENLLLKESNISNENMRTMISNRVFWNLAKNSNISQRRCYAAASVLTPTYQNVQVKRNYASKQNLLRFPVLSLSDTLGKFMKSVKPILTDKEFEQQQQATYEFTLKEGFVLQSLLEVVGKKEKNWLAERWLKAAYLQYRSPVTVFSSPAMTFPPKKFKDKAEFLEYTAKVIYGLGEFKNMVDEEKIPIVKMGKLELDNSQFGKVFGTCRIPKKGEDDMLYNPSSNYVVVIYRNHFFKMSLFNNSKQLLKVKVLESELKKILDAVNNPGQRYGLLTTDNRDNWAKAYEHAMKLPGNAKSIKAIQESLFTVSIDDAIDITEGQEYNTMAAQLIHGGGCCQNSANRWMDKTIQLVVNQSGIVGFTYEHSPAEGQPIAMMMDHIVKSTCDPAFGCGGADCNYDGMEQLCLAEMDDTLKKAADAAKQNVNCLAQDLEIEVLTYSGYGKNFIKKQRLGPDSYVQMAIQLAFHKLHKVPGAQYESAHLRIYEGGRTETIRSCSEQSVAFCESMANKNCVDSVRADLLRAAVNSHQELTKAALQGRGVDRHLLGLKMMATENKLPVPAFYTSPGYLKSTHFRLSTSQVATPYQAFMAYGPLVRDGYGCCYNPRDNDIILACSGWASEKSTDVKLFAEALKVALCEMRETLEGAAEAKSKL